MRKEDIVVAYRGEEVQVGLFRERGAERPARVLSSGLPLARWLKISEAAEPFIEEAGRRGWGREEAEEGVHWLAKFFQDAPVGEITAADAWRFWSSIRKGRRGRSKIDSERAEVILRAATRYLLFLGAEGVVGAGAGRCLAGLMGGN